MFRKLAQHFRNVLAVASIAALLALAQLGPVVECHADDDEAKPRRVLLLSQGPDGHPRATHGYTAGMNVLQACLKPISGVEVNHVIADGPWPTGPDLIRDTDCVVLFLSEGARWIHEDPRRLEAFAHLASRGGGFVALHWGMGTKEARYIDGYLKLFGGCHGGDDRKYKVLDANVKVVAPEHQIVNGIRDFSLREEFYYALKFVPPSDKFTPILETQIDGESQTVAWSWQRGDGGRSFGFTGGHFHKNWSRAEYRRLMTQGVLWSLKLPVPADGAAVEVPRESLVLPVEDR